MSFHIRTTVDQETGMTQIVSIELGELSIIFENHGAHINVCVVGEKRKETPEEMTLTPEEVSTFAVAFQGLRTKKNSG